jgi:hypothetical protein
MISSIQTTILDDLPIVTDRSISVVYKTCKIGKTYNSFAGRNVGLLFFFKGVFDMR